MKIQTLNKVQEKKLLKLCERFFPEYTFNSWGLTSSSEGMLKYYLTSTKDDGKADAEFIHWYQLCMTELPKRIWESCWTKEDLERRYPTLFLLDDTFEGRNPIPEILIIRNVHPVDYLYEFIKQLKIVYKI